MTPKNEEQFKEIRDQRQQELRRSAIQMFSKKGFAETKISDITSNARLSHGLFYHYFASKEALYNEVILEILEDFIQLIEEAQHLGQPALRKMEWLTDATQAGSILEGAYRHILVMQALYSDHLKDSVKQDIVMLYKQSVDGIAAIIQEGQQDGSFIDGDPAELATYHLALSHGLLLWNARTDAPIKVSTDKVLRQLKKSGNGVPGHE